MNPPNNTPHIRRAFEKLYSRFGPNNQQSFRYLVQSDQILPLGPNEALPDNTPPHSTTLSQKEAENIVKKDLGKEIPSNTTQPYRIYRAGKILSLKKIVNEDHPQYIWEVHKSTEEKGLLENPEYKLLWPERQKNALASLLRNATKVALQIVSYDMGAKPPPFITLCKVELPEEEYARAIITHGTTKREANQKAKQEATQIWREDPEVQAYHEGYRKKVLTCLTLRECKKILHLLQKEIDKEEK